MTSERSFAVPAEAQVLAWFDELSNWGRWGDDDALGTLNLVDDDARRRGLGAAVAMTTIACGRPIRRGVGTTQPTLRFVTRSGTEAPERGMGFADDWWGMGIHGFDLTHLDAPSHLFWNGHMYNGRRSTEVTTNGGAGFGDVTAAQGIATRGVLLDLPRARGVRQLDSGTAIGPGELDSCAVSAGVDIGPGDALIVRTGRDAGGAGTAQELMGAGTPGLHAACLPWLRERGVALLVSDVASDVMPSGYRGISMPIHAIGITAMGLWLLDNAWLEDLADACEAANRHAFLFVVSPLALVGGTGSPVNPLAVL